MRDPELRCDTTMILQLHASTKENYENIARKKTILQLTKLMNVEPSGCKLR